MIMKLDKRKRHSTYKKALEYVTENGWQHGGFCYIIDVRVNDNKDASTHKYLEELYPELWKHRPKEGKHWGVFWFEVYADKDKKREKILKQAINETKPNGISKRGRIKKRASLPSVR